MTYSPEDIPEYVRTTNAITPEDEARRLAVMEEIERLADEAANRDRAKIVAYVKSKSYEDLCFLSAASEAELQRRNIAANPEGY